MQTNTLALAVTKGLALSTVLEYKEDNKRVFTDYAGYEFKAQFRASKSPTATLFATVVPVSVGLGQLRLSLTKEQTALFTGQNLFYDILCSNDAGVTTDKIFEGTVTLAVPTSVTQWENVPPITTCNQVNDAAITTTTDVTLVPDEIGASTYYTTNGSTPTVSSTKYTAPFRLTAGTHAIKFFSVDTAGNVEAVKTVTNVVVS
jgi:hypothetical protein